jgi:uncharacterized protein (TIGR03000 family)
MGGCSTGGCGTYAAAGSACGGVSCAAPAAGKAMAMTTPASATLVVNLPANATLTIDDVPTVSTSSQRVFQTPALPTGRTFQYTLKASVIRDGRVETMTRQVAVRAGEATRVSFDAPSATAVASR